MVEAGVGQLQAEGIFPIQLTAHRIRCLPAGQARYELQHRHLC